MRSRALVLMAGAALTLASQRCASCHQTQGFCTAACAASRQFSNTVKLGKMVLRW